MPAKDRAYGIITCGAAVGSGEWKASYLRAKAEEVCRVARRVTTALMAEDTRCASISLYLSMQCRIDYFLATHLPSETREMAEIVDAGLRECYAQVMGQDLMDPDGIALRDGTPVAEDKQFTRDRALLKACHGGLGYRSHWERCLFLNSLNSIAPQMAGGARPLWAELRATLGGAADFNPKQKEKRWVAFFSSGSRYGEELREEIIRMKELFEQSSADAGREGTEEHGVFDAEPEAFGVLAKEGGGEVHKLQKAMFDTIKTQC